jgi:nucleoside-diphosphate-sugar epimerase
MARLLITGATGGLGLALIALAREAGHDVLATGRSAAVGARIEAEGTRFVRADLCDHDGLESLCRGREAVIHAAALSASWGQAERFERINVDATRALLDAARRAGCARFVFVSSPSIFARFADRVGMASSDPPAAPPLNHYARTKLAAERLVLAADAPGFATCAIRPRAIVGPDDQVLLPRLAELVGRRRVPLPRRGQALIELTDARDAAHAILLAESRIDAVAGRGINVSGGRAHRVRDIAEALAAALGRNPRFVDLPVGIGRAIATALELAARSVGSNREPLLTRYTLATLAYSQTFDHDETERLIGYRPRHDALATLLAEARRRYR